MIKRHAHAYPDARPTRFKELGYIKLAPRVWRIVDFVQTAYNNQVDAEAGRPVMNLPSCTGPSYTTKTELLADLDRYATGYGATPQ